MINTLCIILNWNNPLDTIAVTNEVLIHHAASVIIVDNNSSDNSKIIIGKHYRKNWINKSDINTRELQSQKELYLVAMAENLGFAKAINQIIRNTHKSFKYYWLLNNDAIPGENALQQLEQTLESNPTFGFAGSVILDFYEREKIQCCAVKYYPLAGVSKLIRKDQFIGISSTTLEKKNNYDFQHGASLLINTKHLERLGLMDENFFLYFEEQDWQIRARKIGIDNILVMSSHVYHKGSQSTKNAKFLFYYYYNISAIYYSRKHHPVYLPITIISLFIITLIRTKLRLKSIWWGLKGIFKGLYMSKSNEISEKGKFI